MFEICLTAGWAACVVLAGLVAGLPPNYDDLDYTADQPVGEKVDIEQADPQSNAIHVAHNNPKDR